MTAVYAHDVLQPQLVELIRAVNAARARVLKTAAATAAEGSSNHPEHDDEAIHDFRVALRRLRTILRPLRPLYGKRSVRELSAELKQIADMTGELRDEEVLRETLTELEVPERTRPALDRWIAMRRKHEATERRHIAERLALTQLDHEQPTGAGLKKSLKSLSKLIKKGPRHPTPLDALARHGLGRALAEVRAFAAGISAHDIDAMHDLRIRFKRLRYCSELFAEPIGLSGTVTKSATKMQKRLGQLHDLDEALARVGRGRGLSPGHRASVLAALRRARVATAQRCARELRKEMKQIETSFAEIDPPPRRRPLSVVPLPTNAASRTSGKLPAKRPATKTPTKPPTVSADKRPPAKAMKKTPAKRTPPKKTSTAKPLLKKAAAKRAPAKKAAATKAPAKKVAAKKAPSKNTDGSADAG